MEQGLLIFMGSKYLIMDLSKISALPPEGADKGTAKQYLKQLHKELFELQSVFYADGRYGLLIILQGMDTSGKDGICRHVMTAMNPLGVQVKSFKKPTPTEEEHDFLWRVYPHFPPKGMIQVFNRSYYEDILVPSVEGNLSEDILAHRYELINTIEKHLALNNIHVLKFFLHISREKQLEKIANRKLKLRKKWKYDRKDEITDEKWQKYQEVYNKIMSDCQQNPWHIIPADKRWHRNEKVAIILRNYMQDLDLRYPQGPVNR